MSWWTRIRAVFRREAGDVKEGLSKVGRSLDAELARKEREQAATPEERIDMILDAQQAEDARFEELENKVRGVSAGADPTEEVAGEEAPPAPDA
jgi:hypothetical protein